MAIIDWLYDDLISAMSGVSPDDTCMQITLQQMRPWDANIDDVIDNWRTTGFYTVEQMSQINKLAVETIGVAGEAVHKAINELQLPGHREALHKALDSLHDPLISPLKFIDAVREATAKGINVIEAQGYKRFIVNVLKAARNAKLTSTFVACARPSLLLSIITKLGQVAEALITLVKTAGTIVKTIGQAVLKVPDLLGSLFKFISYLPWFVVLGGGYYVATKTVLPPKYDPLKLRDRETFKPWKRKGE